MRYGERRPPGWGTTARSASDITQNDIQSILTSTGYHVITDQNPPEYPLTVEEAVRQAIIASGTPSGKISAIVWNNIVNRAMALLKSSSSATRAAVEAMMAYKGLKKEEPGGNGNGGNGNTTGNLGGGFSLRSIAVLGILLLAISQ